MKETQEKGNRDRQKQEDRKGREREGTTLGDKRLRDRVIESEIELCKTSPASSEIGRPSLPKAVLWCRCTSLRSLSRFISCDAFIHFRSRCKLVLGSSSEMLKLSKLLRYCSEPTSIPLPFLCAVLSLLSCFSLTAGHD